MRRLFIRAWAALHNCDADFRDGIAAVRFFRGRKGAVTTMNIAYGYSYQSVPISKLFHTLRFYDVMAQRAFDRYASGRYLPGDITPDGVEVI